MFVWDYFVAKNIQEKNFMVSQYPRKYFNNELKSLALYIAIVVQLLSLYSLLYKSFFLVRFITEQ